MSLPSIPVLLSIPGKGSTALSSEVLFPESTAALLCTSLGIYAPLSLRSCDVMDKDPPLRRADKNPHTEVLCHSCVTPRAPSSPRIFFFFLSVLDLHCYMGISLVVTSEGLLSICSAWTSRCSDFSCCSGVQALGV